MLRLRRQKFVVWACLFAIWLGVLMPTVSQSLRASGAAQISGDICTVTGLVQAPVEHGKSSAPADDHLNACGYCTLLANCPPPVASFDLLFATSAAVSRTLPLLYTYLPPRPFRGRTHPLDPPQTTA
ncbi:hypothetical protein CAter282_2729 [Collimonas arenae]|uniref:DUF2946 domain-containing protein n=1 Tax=Collimonas arenae TaxID=279058 RepID=A0A127QK56_9BURK|nr:DUF2946 domain-containing protein [Collimonas arenae]AMP00575.1 hypothetical protein CAter10_3005 [Collimonas arenae]AMP10459.1 hypothetical protein CAter282_2729 [Collimonas arenae]